MSKPLNWYLRRHSLLYKIRFQLVSKNVSPMRIESFCYNSINPKKDIPLIYLQLNPSIFPQEKSNLNDFKKALKIAKWLRNQVKGGPGLGKSSETALLKMMNGEGGVCSDFSQVYNNFCVVNDIKVREWGLKIVSKDATTSGGHSFNEVYSNELQKWFIIDVAKSIYFYHLDSNVPLSVFELLDLKKENKEIQFFNFNKKITPDDQRIQNLYLISNSFPFLITNYCNKTYDYFLNKMAVFPESLIHGLVFLLGKSYAFEFPDNKHNTKIN
ncbi:transglutaminase domain-containing protein [Flavobacterium granuli]|uniref:Transglutaminase superfamily protein n=1 Tax=Flavobacterium granuli TaxID=280093 RepID=A0A1M5LQ62_9FLAO|nr:transglutaminase domain-containing protein [Flavobacterium granuli]PRZ24066.1 transglutaminase superfamily protein [Flavobacterium granuli]SHG67292.1 Transglutaminase-like superfamily protein [Flavobacterium granuli]